jgi:hypothetical protein
MFSLCNPRMEPTLAGGDHDNTRLPRRAALTASLAALLPVKLQAAHAPPRQPAAAPLASPDEPGPEATA